MTKWGTDRDGRRRGETERDTEVREEKGNRGRRRTMRQIRRLALNLKSSCLCLPSHGPRRGLTLFLWLLFLAVVWSVRLTGCLTGGMSLELLEAMLISSP